MVDKIRIDNKAVGQRIRKEREKFDLSREEFAEIIGLSDYYLGQLERGQRQMSLPVLVKIATSLHVSLDYLIFGKNKIDNSCYYINEIPNENDKHYEIDLKTEIIELTNKCSYKEFRLINKIIKTILPYIRES